MSQMGRTGQSTIATQLDPGALSASMNNEGKGTNEVRVPALKSLAMLATPICFWVNENFSLSFTGRGR